MKAQVKKPVQKPLISIGMIVKNEEKTLEDCLKAMSPIREAVPSELIVVDTGSTDRTVEIAERYADKVLHFEWCNDFAAARNVSLEAASGKWYLYLDGDEVLEENCTPLIEFLKTPNNPYKSASLLCRNYGDEARTVYSDFRMIRLHRRTPQTRFEGAIHERIAAYNVPTKDLPIIVHHTGYIEGIHESKRRRNRKLLLLDLEKDPDDLRTLRHLLDTYGMETLPDIVEQNRIARKIIRISEESDGINTEWLYAYYALVLSAVNRREYAAAQQLLQEYYDKKGAEEFAADINMSFFKGMVSFDNHDYSAAKKAYLDYQRLCALYWDGKLNTPDVYSMTLPQLHPYPHALSCYATAICWQNEGNYPEMKGSLERAGALTEKTLERADASLMTEFLYAYEAEDFSRLAGLLGEASFLQNGEGWKVFAEWFEKRFEQFEERKKDACLTIAQTDLQNPFAQLCRLRTAQTREQAQELLEQLLDDPDAVKTPLFADLLYATVFYQFDLQHTLSALDSSLVERYWETLAKQRPDWPELLDTYLMEHPLQESDPPVCWFWQTRLMLSLLLSPEPDTKVLFQQPWLDEERFASLAQRYLDAMTHYCRMVYQPAMLLPENRVALPAEYRFVIGWQEAEALQKEQGDGACLQRLGEMLQEFPLMNRLIGLFTARTRQRLEAQKQQREEFEALAENVKQQFYRLASDGQIAHAAQILESYRALCPDDPELLLMQSQLDGPRYTLES